MKEKAAVLLKKSERQKTICCRIIGTGLWCRARFFSALFTHLFL